ncbi:MAG: hypothetical protein J5682_07435 [Prevotella sp.]|nr:hypothetical protein [Prevotella sp.]
MDKKAYITPETTCVTIVAAKMIATSPNGGKVYDESAGEGVGGLSRQNSGGGWDDEED